MIDETGKRRSRRTSAACLLNFSLSSPNLSEKGAGMPLRTTLQTILTEYHTAMAEPLEGHKLANFIRHSAASEVNGALGELGAGLIVEGGAGAGNWAAVPWISVFDPAITTSATRGYECLNPIRARGVKKQAGSLLAGTLPSSNAYAH